MNEDQVCKVDVGENTIHLTNGIVTVVYDTRLGYISLTSHTENVICFSKGYVLIHTDREVLDSRKMVYKSFSALDFQDEKIKGKAIVLKVQDVDKTADLSIKISVYEKISGFSLVIQYRNRTNEVLVKSLDTLVIDVDDDSRVVTGWGKKNLRFFRNGFHSWELSQTFPIDVGENLSHYFSVLKNIESQDTLVIGFTTLADQLSTVSVRGRDEEKSRLALIAATSHSDHIPVTEKDTIVSEEMLVLYSKDARRSLEEYMNFVAQRMDAIKWKNVPVGWCSWYFYYTMPDEGEIIENTDFLAERFGKDIEWIQIDDGYQQKVGDWEENSRFGSGLAALVKKIKERGYRAGVWTAPFVASEHSEIFKDKRDWFVRDEDNNPIVVGENPLWLGNYYALDLTNPKVLKHIKSVFSKLKQDGFDYFKIDFLYHAALLGQRHDTKITRAQAIRKGLQVIRDAVGDDLILGCGAPLGPCIGIVNMMRIGTDIATHWRYDWGGGVYECSVNTMTRALMHDRWWINDPDCVLVRQDDNELSEDEVKLWLNVVALSGGAVLLSDRMMEVSEERLGFLDKILPPYRKTAIALDALEKTNPSIFALPIESPVGQWVVLGLINLNETPIDITVELESLGLDPTVPHHVFDFWDSEYHGLSEDQIAVFGIKPHTSKLLVIKPESEIPSILSSSIHFTQGAIELGDVDWNDGGKELSMTIKRSTRKEESIFFVFGNQWIPSRAYVDDEKVAFEEIAPEVVAVKHQFKKGQILRVAFKQ